MTNLIKSRECMQSGFAKSLEQWDDWNWQQFSAIRNVENLLQVFPNLDNATITKIKENSQRVKFKLTPYMISLIRRNPSGNPDPDDPIWNLYVPLYKPLAINESLNHILCENWEIPEDMVNPILQHKYDNRVNFRIQNSCLAYCTYCFEAKRVLDRDSTIGGFKEALFQESLEYIRRSEGVQEVILSGGDPLTLSNERLNRILIEIRQIPGLRALRIQTHAFTQNPFRIDDEFVKLLIQNDVSAIGIHISHPNEITVEFREALDRILQRGCKVLLLAQIPLLKNINDTEAILEELFMTLYEIGVKPYYLLHAMPGTLGEKHFRTSIRRGVEIMMNMKRRISNPALPEYVIVHAKGKHTVPLEIQGTPEFQYCAKGRVRFRNWKGEWCEYLDVGAD